MITIGGYSAAAPLLLVTEYPASVGGGGAVILRSLLADVPRETLLWASLTRDDKGARQDATLVKGSARLGSLLGRQSPTVDALLAGQLADEIRALAAARGARAIWIILHGAMVHVAARLLAHKTLPVHLTVHDDPPFGVALQSRRHVALVPLLERDLGYALKRADSIDVISDGMATRYRQRFGVESVVVHRGLTGPVAAHAAHVADGVLDVGVMGNTYGYSQLPLLAQAVAEAAGALSLRPRVTVVGKGLGERLRDEFAGRVEVEPTGHLDEARAVERLSRCFALYLNYPFSARAAVLRQTSFPTKLSSYLLAARPLLAHAPRDSSIAPLERLGGFVTWWASERPSDGAAALRDLWRRPAAHESQHVVAEAQRARLYDLATNRAKLFGALEALVTKRS